MVSLKSQTLKQKQKSRASKALRAEHVPVEIVWHGKKQPATVHFANGKQGAGACISCANPRCMEFAVEELRSPQFQDFPLDLNQDVCPTKAITWPVDSATPVIDASACIACGLCLTRCPTSAISFDENTKAHINTDSTAFFEPSTDARHFDTIAKFDAAKKTGAILIETDEDLARVYETLESVASKQTTQFPNHLVRNLLLALGVKALMRRRGDTNVRMDMVFDADGAKGTMEVELGTGVIDAPRNILDNVAISVARYKQDKNSVIPAIACLNLPNYRSEYWQVIKDVRDVLKLKIGTVTIGLLVVLVWNRVKLSSDALKALYIDADNHSLLEAFQKILGRKTVLAKSLPRVVEPEK